MEAADFDSSTQKPKDKHRSRTMPKSTINPDLIKYSVHSQLRVVPPPDCTYDYIMQAYYLHH